MDLAGRVFSQQLDRDKPLWEVWLVEGLEGDRFAMLSKTHHALVDGISGVDIMSVLFDTLAGAGRSRRPRATAGCRGRCPSRAQLLARGAARARHDPGRGRPLGARRLPRPAPHPRRRARRRRRRRRDGLGGAQPGAAAAPTTSRSARTGASPGCAPSLRDIKAIKDSLGGTVNDVVLATVAGALGRHLRRRGQNTDGLELKAMVPVSVRQDVERGALGNQVAAMMAPLPVWCQEPVARLDIVREELKDLKSGGQAVGAQVLTDLSGLRAVRRSWTRRRG